MPRPADEWLASLAHTQHAGGNSLLPEEAAARDHNGVMLQAGFFCARKGENQLRDITDRWPAMSLEPPNANPVLPHGCQLAARTPPAVGTQQLRATCLDLANYFCSLRVLYAKVQRNAVPAFSPATLMEAGVDVPADLQSRKLLQPAWTTLSMGDINALAHAQEAHESMLAHAGFSLSRRLSSSQMLRYAHPPPHSPTLLGAYVDDLSILQIIKEDDAARADGALATHQGVLL